MTDEMVARIEEILWPDGPRQNVWMIADGARTVDIFRFLLDCHLEYACLYGGPLTPDLEMAAPYLVQLDHGYRDTHRLIRQAWGNSWGVFLRSDTSLKKLRRHLREFLVVRDTKGTRMVFRYYDPRVLRVYLPTCEVGELRTVFGPIECFWAEGDCREKVLEFRLHRGNLVQNTLSLATGTAHRGLPFDTTGSNRMSDGEGRAFRTLTIRNAQLAAFSQAEARKFEDWMLLHLRQFFPGHCQSLDDQQLRQRVAHGISRAATYGITGKRDVCKYLQLMTVFGPDFDADQRFPWAREVLQARKHSGMRSEARVMALQQAALDHLREARLGEA